jgi:ABC-type sugar transport system ATPase subunit
VHGVSCAVADGELVVVVGPWECGKSNPLRMVAGLEGLSAGNVAAVRPEYIHLFDRETGRRL